MDHVNETLLLSLKQEIKTINEVIERISQLSGESNEIKSWLFPTKSYQFVSGLIESGGLSEVDDLRSYLELIIDRLYVGIRLILNCIDTKIVEVKENRLIRRPKQLTLGFSFQALWTIISVTLLQNMNRTTNKETTTYDRDNTTFYTFNKETQTDIIALNRCDSCSSAILCMKNLMESFENEKIGELHSKRQIIRPKIYDITQFGCMLQATSTIENSLSSLFEKLFIKQEENDLLKSENQKLKSDISHKFGKITLLEREVDILKEKYEKDVFKITLLSSQNEDLMQTKTKHEFHIKTLDEIIYNLNNSIKRYKENIQTIMQEKNEFNNYLKRISEKQKDLSKLSLILHKKLIVIEDQHVLIGNSLKYQEDIIDSINNKLNSFVKLYDVLKTKIGHIQESLQDNSSFIISKCKNFQNKMKQQIEDISVCELRMSQSQSVPNFQVKGNPVEDLTRQIEENNQKIKVLQKENVKLQNILVRFNRRKD